MALCNHAEPLWQCDWQGLACVESKRRWVRSSQWRGKGQACWAGLLACVGRRKQAARKSRQRAKTGGARTAARGVARSHTALRRCTWRLLVSREGSTPQRWSFCSKRVCKPGHHLVCTMSVSAASKQRRENVSRNPPHAALHCRDDPHVVRCAIARTWEAARNLARPGSLSLALKSWVCVCITAWTCLCSRCIGPITQRKIHCRDPPRVAGRVARDRHTPRSVVAHGGCL